MENKIQDIEHYIGILKGKVLSLDHYDKPSLEKRINKLHNTVISLVNEGQKSSHKEYLSKGETRASGGGFKGAEINGLEHK